MTVSDAEARSQAAEQGQALPELASGVSEAEVQWVWYEGEQHSCWLPAGYEEFSSWEDWPVEVGWDLDRALGGGYGESAVGFASFVVVRLRLPDGDRVVSVLPPMSEEEYWGWSSSEGPSLIAEEANDDYYAAFLTGFERRSKDDTALLAEAIAHFVPWDEADHLHPGGFELRDGPAGRFTIVERDGSLAKTFDDLHIAARYLSKMATAWGATVEVVSERWPGETG